MTKREIDLVLERFDQTESELQRQIIVKVMEDRIRLLDALEELLKETDGGTQLCGRPTYEKAITAVAKAKGGGK